MNDEYAVYQYRGCTIHIEYDRDAQNPRDDDNVGTMVCWHNRYELGDVQPAVCAEAYLKSLPKGSIILPLYLYDHSGITIRTSAFSCPWDSGQVGFIYVSPEKAKKEWPQKRYWRKQAIKYLQQEVATYDEYLTGSVYGYICEGPDGEEIGSCWGFFGDDGCKEDGYAVKDCAKPAIDHWLAKQEAEAAEVLYWKSRDVLTV